MPSDPPSALCEVCGERETKNRGLLQVNKRYFIVPLCEAHADLSAAETVECAYDYAGLPFVRALVEQDVVTAAEASRHLPASESIDRSASSS